MKIDRKRLEAIIKEEILKLYEINPAHDSKGRWAKKGKGKVYSLTANAVDNLGDDSELEAPARGRVSSGGKISSKYGMNTGDEDTQCGRLKIDGKSKKKTRSCKDYPNNYWDNQNEEKERDLMSPADDAYVKALVMKQVKQALGQVQKTGGAGGRGCSWNEIMRALNDIETASKPRKTEKET